MLYQNFPKRLLAFWVGNLPKTLCLKIRGTKICSGILPKSYDFFDTCLKDLGGT